MCLADLVLVSRLQKSVGWHDDGWRICSTARYKVRAVRIGEGVSACYSVVRKLGHLVQESRYSRIAAMVVVIV